MNEPEDLRARMAEAQKKSFTSSRNPYPSPRPQEAYRKPLRPILCAILGSFRTCQLNLTVIDAGNLAASPFLEVAPMLPSILQKVLRDRHLHLGAASSIPGLPFTAIDPCSHWAFTRNCHLE
jgi:hypothetical protein